jgi:hypothetical protein
MHDAMNTWVRCELCGRRVPPVLITLHHLTPRQRGGRREHKARLCKPCHKQLHATFYNGQLARAYNSLEVLRAAAELQPFLRWIRKQAPDRNFRTMTAESRPGRGRRRIAPRRRLR